MTATLSKKPDDYGATNNASLDSSNSSLGGSNSVNSSLDSKVNKIATSLIPPQTSSCGTIKRLGQTIVEHSPYLVRIAVLLLLAVAITAVLAHFAILVPLIAPFLATCIAVFIILSLSLHMLKRKLTHKYRSLQESLTIQTFETLKKANIPLPEAGKRWEKPLATIRNLIDPTNQKPRRFSDLQDFYRAYREIYSSASFQAALLTTAKQPIVRFMEDLAVEIMEHVDANSVYMKFGKELRGKNPAPTDPQELATFIQMRMKHRPFGTLNRNSWLSYFVMMILQPEMSCESIRSKNLGVHFDDSIKNGNFAHRGPEFAIGKKKIQTIYAPGSIDPLIAMYLNHRSDSKDKKLYIHHLQDFSVRGEGPRVALMQTFGNDAISISNTFEDGLFWKGKQDTSNTAADFLQHYKNQFNTSGDQSYKVDPGILDQAIAAAARLFSEVTFKNPPRKEDHEKKQMIMFTVQAFICLGEMQKTDIFWVPCRQMYDRGATMMSMIAYLLDVFNDHQLTETDADQRLGMLAARAMLENREPIRRRNRPLFDMQNYFHGKTTFLKDVLNDFINKTDAGRSSLDVEKR